MVFQRDRCKNHCFFSSAFLPWVTRKEPLQLDTAGSMSPAASGVFQSRQHRLQVRNLGKPSASSCWLSLAPRQRFWDLQMCWVRGAYLFFVFFSFVSRPPVPSLWVNVQAVMKAKETKLCWTCNHRWWQRIKYSGFEQSSLRNIATPCGKAWKWPHRN